MPKLKAGTIMPTPAEDAAITAAALADPDAAPFTDAEWQRFLTEYLDRPSENVIDKTRKIHDDYIHDFTFDSGQIKNIYLLDKKKTSPVTAYKSSDNLAKQVNTPTAMMSLS